MKTKKQKSLAEVVWNLCYGMGSYEWSKIQEYERKDCRHIASRIRREVLRRESQKIREKAIQEFFCDIQPELYSIDERRAAVAASAVILGEPMERTK